jgi:CubicO group peptidase (beta-lactamase class C family)
MTEKTRQGAAARAVDTLFEARTRDERAPSAAYGLFDRHGLFHTGSTGAVNGRPPTADTIYRIASCTKSFTATALLALRDAGAITLDDPVTEYVPAFADVVLPSDDSPVPTVRMLMTMSAGFPTDDPWGDRQESLTDAELDAVLRTGLRFDSLPGTRFAYSNLGYALLGRVVSVASGRDYREVVTDQILTPLGLTSTSFTFPVESAERVAIGHRRLDGEWQPLPFSGPGAFSPIGGLFSTVADLSRWARWLSSAFSTGDDRAADGDFDGILSRASRRELQQAARQISGLTAHPSGYGFGLFVEDVPELGSIVAHSGGYPGFSAHMRWQPASGIGMVAFENATYAQVSVPTTTALHGLLQSLQATPGPTVWPETLTARALVEAALEGAELPTAWVSENVEWGIPFTTRRAAWREALDTIGGLDEVTTPEPLRPFDAAQGDESGAPSQLVWHRDGARGRLRLEVRLTPEATPRIQMVTVRPERLG